MQDSYVGDIGDYGKYGLLRALSATGLKLFINWYKTCPDAKNLNKNNDGKFTEYLKPKNASKYKKYDEDLYYKLCPIVHYSRSIEEIQNSGILDARFYDSIIDNKNRADWHQKSLKSSAASDVVFLDPDNGIETENMASTKKNSIKHVKWPEISDYYSNHSVIVYQHQPRVKYNIFINNLLKQQREHIENTVDRIKIVSYSSFVKRFYIMFIHQNHAEFFQHAVDKMSNRIKNFCCNVPVPKHSN